MKVLAIGRSGQVAMSVVERARCHGSEVVTIGRPELDLQSGTLLEDALLRAIDDCAPDVVVNCAAYTAVDNAENDGDRAFAINAEAPGHCARATDRSGVPFVHVSTDYVFDGALDRPYRPSDPVAPLGVYGRSKEQGERAVRDATDEHLILRTAWVTSPFGSNFVKTMLRLAQSRDEVRVVHDQCGSPTSALELADAILLASRHLVEAKRGAGETHHVAGRGKASWADLARLVFDESAIVGGPSARVENITTADFPTIAPRPRNSCLDTTSFERTFGVDLSEWQAPQRHVVRRLSDMHVDVPTGLPES